MDIYKIGKVVAGIFIIGALMYGAGLIISWLREEITEELGKL